MPAHRFRPTLERLEDRLVPDAMVWKGTISAAWDANTPGNWYNTTKNAVATWVPGTAGHTTDDVKFDRSATQNCDLNMDVTLKSLTLDGTNGSDFQKILTIDGGHSADIVNGTFTYGNGTLNLTAGGSGSYIALDNSTGNWTSGDFSSTVGGGAVYVYNGSTLNTLQNGWDLGASLVIGENVLGSDSAGTLNISSTTVGMTQNLKLNQSAKIINHPKGIINFLQNVNSDTKGGIVAATGSNSSITNYGAINRTTTDSGNAYLNIAVPVTQTGNDTNCAITLGAGCLINFSATPTGLTVNGGKLKSGKGSHYKGEVKNPGGTIEGDTSGGTGNVDFYFDNDLTLNGGTILFDYTAGSWGRLHIGGNFTVMSGGMIDINVDGSTNGQSDQINVGGTWTLNGGYLLVNTVNASPQSGWAYVFVTATTTVGSAWGGLSNSGYPASYRFDSNNPGQLDVQ